MMLFSWERVEKDKEEINKINVFPVPDQDTGSNLAKTLSGIKESIVDKDFKNLKEISEAALDGAMTTAQGNAGIIYTGFLAGFLPVLEKKESVGTQELSQAFKKGLERARSSIQDPKEGTILDVIEATSKTFEKESVKEKNIIVLLQKATENAHQALLETQDKMEILKKANVVDAGGLGFLMILESYLDALNGDKEKEQEIIITEKPSEKVRRFIQTVSNRYEVVALIESPRITEKELQDKLSKLGNSLDMVTIGNRIKIHIHTDFTDDVKEIIRKAGRVNQIRVEDMTREAVGEESLRNISIGIIVDQEADLTAKICERYDIKTIPSSFTDQDFEQVCDEQLKKFKNLLIITASSELSTSFQRAMEARSKLSDPYKVYVLDSLNFSAGQALLTLRSIELIREQREMRETIKMLNKKAVEIQTYVFLPSVKSNGFLPRQMASWIKRWQRLGGNPLLGIRRGNWVRAGLYLGTKSGSEAIFKEIKSESKKQRKRGFKIRVVIAHNNNLEQAKELKNRLKAIKAEVSFTSVVSSVWKKKVTPGSLIVAWDIIE